MRSVEGPIEGPFTGPVEGPVEGDPPIGDSPVRVAWSERDRTDMEGATPAANSAAAATSLLLFECAPPELIWAAAVLSTGALRSGASALSPFNPPALIVRRRKVRRIIVRTQLLIQRIQRKYISLLEMGQYPSNT